MGTRTVAPGTRLPARRGPALTHTVVLAGGRASRLGGAPKPLLARDGTTLLDRAVRIGAGAGDPDGTVVVVGPPALVASLGPPTGRVVTTHEDPPLTGPARALAAGVAALAAAPGSAAAPDGTRTVAPDDGTGLDPTPAFRAAVGLGLDRPGPTSRDPAPAATVVLVLACDMPGAQAAVGPLLTALEQAPGRAGAVAVGDDGHPQWLLSAWRHEPLARACAALPPGGANESVRCLLAPLDPVMVAVPDDACADIDTWDRAAAQGYTQTKDEKHEPVLAPRPLGASGTSTPPRHTITEEA